MKDLEKATDMEIAIDMANHINHPCHFEKGSEEYLALRQSYIAWATDESMPRFTNPHAKTFLVNVISQYNP